MLYIHLLRLAIFTLLVLFLSINPSYAIKWCDASFNRAGYDLNAKDPDHSHNMFSEPRWQCVESDGLNDQKSVFTDFEAAANLCLDNHTPFQELRDFARFPLELVRGADSVTIVEENFQENACISVGSGPENETVESYIGHYTISVNQSDLFYYTAMFNGEITSAEDQKDIQFIPWKMPEGKINYLRYTPRLEVSRCFDSVCGDNTTGNAQYIESPIDASNGSVDVTLPVFSAQFPGLLPVAMHYSSWPIVEKTKTRNINSTALKHKNKINKHASFWTKSWHHSYDKRLDRIYGDDSEITNIYLYLPSEDTLIFEKNGDTWHCISHPGVKAIISQLGDSEFEVRRPDGYVERYLSGRLNLIQYPDGRELTFTPGYSNRQFSLTIKQNSPEIGVVIVHDAIGNVLQIRALTDESYHFDFEYQQGGLFTDNKLIAIQQPDGSRLTLNQTEVDFGINPLYLLNSVSLAGHELMSFSYAEDGRANVVHYLSGQEYRMSFTGEESAQGVGPYGAMYQFSSTKKETGTSDYFGDITISSLTSVNCDNCGYSKTLSYEGNGQLSNVNRSGSLPYSANFSDGLLSHVDYNVSDSRNYTWDTSKQLLTAVAGSNILNTSLTYDKGHVSSVTSSGDGSNRTVSLPIENTQIKKLSGVHNNQLSIDYSVEGFIKSITNRLGHKNQYKQFNHLGQPQQVIDENGMSSVLSYDVMGRLLSMNSDDGDALTVQYGPLGQPVSGSFNGTQTTFGYDEKQRIISSTGQCQPNTTYSYKTNGLVASSTQSHNGVSETTLYDYDVEGALRKATTNTNGAQHVVNYNTRGQVSSKSDGGNTTTYNYDGNGKLLGMLTNGEQQANYAIGTLNRVSSITAPGGRQTSFTYSGLGQLARQENPNWSYRQYGYAANGLLTSRETPYFLSQFTYDLADRRQSVTFTEKDNAAPTINVHYGYDDASLVAGAKNYGIGRLTSLTNYYTGYRYRYDINGRIQQQFTTQFDGSGDVTADNTLVNETSIGYAYSQQGDVTQVDYPSGDTLSYTRAPCSGQVTAIHWNNQLLANLTQASLLNPFNKAELNNGLSISRQFDGRSRLTQNQLSNTTSNTLIWQQDYGFDAKNNVATINTPTNNIQVGGDQNFIYDIHNRLTNATGSYGELAFDYNVHSQRTLKASNGINVKLDYNPDNDQLAALKHNDDTLIKSYLFDAEGYRTQSGAWKYQYNAAGRLVTVRNNDNWVATYTYDANGKRSSKTTADGTLYFYYDINGRLLQESKSNGAVVRQYLYTASGELLALVYADNNNNKATYFVHNDHLNTPLYLTDTNGDVVWQAERQPFGETVVSYPTSNPVEFPIRLPGQYFDQETGLHYNQQRYYDPETGLYLRPDPFGIRGGYHTYNYAGQNPLTYVDPEGEFFIMGTIALVSFAMTAYDIYDTVDGLASGRITKEDLAAGYLLNKGIEIGLKALPGVGIGASMVYRAAKKGKWDDVTKEGTTTLYRAGSKAEMDDIAKNGFRALGGQNGYETGKLFATTVEDAAKFGKNNFHFDKIPNHIVKVTVPNSVMKDAYKFRPDGMDAVSISTDSLKQLSGIFLNYNPLVK